MHRTLLKALALTAALLIPVIPARPQAAIKAVTDNTSYNVGAEVKLKVVLPESSGLPAPAPEIKATVRYAEVNKAVSRSPVILNSLVYSPAAHSTGYHPIWRIPLDARTGRYEVDLVAQDSQSHRIILNQQRAASFAVHRKSIRIDRIELGKTLYAPGDPVACAVILKNLTERALANLQVEFSDRYWPWIGPTVGSTDLHIISLAKALSLPGGGKKELSSPRAAVAKAVKQPTVHQYAVVVWDHKRKNVLDIAFSPLVFIQPAGVDSPKPYPSQYLYPELRAVNVRSYRHFYPMELDSPAIRFDHAHTMFASGSEGRVAFSIRNPSTRPWHKVSIRARLVSPDGAEIASNTVAEALDLDASRLEKEIKFTFPAQPGGLYRAEVQVSDPSDQILAASRLELGVNPLPKSILIFCAHEDDEMGHAGLIRAAVENHIPIHFLFLTSGDAGSCDRYYQHSCGPVEALNFGTLRMEEARAALAHLGVPREDIYFLGLPDGGLGEIWYDHLKPSTPYLDVLLATDHAPYEGLPWPNLPYARDSAMEAAKEFIKRLQPELIYAAHPPNERHVDHKVNGYFVIKALQQLLREGVVSPNLTLLVDQVHDPKAQPPTPYRYQEHVLNVSGEVKALTQEAGWYYQSQEGNRAEGNLRTFGQLPRTESYRQVLDWQEHEGWNEKP